MPEYEWINPREISGIDGLRLVLFGAGRGSEEFLEYLESAELTAEVLAIADNDPTLWGLRLLGHPVIDPDALHRLDLDKIVVTSISGRNTIAQQLETMGFQYATDYILIGHCPTAFERNFSLTMRELKSHFNFPGTSCLHIGPGGFLGFETLLASAGANRICSVDNFTFGIQYPDITKNKEDYLKIKNTILSLDIDPEDRNEMCHRFNRLFIEENGKLLLDEDKIEYHFPMDVCRLELPNECFDLVCSFAVLEHVSDPPAAVSEISRVLKPGGIALNVIITQDHRSFSKVGGFHPFSFRIYSEPEWHRIVMRKFYQNRLLPIEWERLHKGNRLKIEKYHIQNRFEIDDRTLDAFHSDFKCFSKKELIEADCLIVAQKR